MSHQHDHRPPPLPITIIGAVPNEPTSAHAADGFRIYHFVQEGAFGFQGPLDLVLDTEGNFVPTTIQQFDLVSAHPNRWNGAGDDRPFLERIRAQGLASVERMIDTSPQIEALVAQLSFNPTTQKTIMEALRRGLRASYAQQTPLDLMTATHLISRLNRGVYRVPSSEAVALFWMDEASQVRARGLTWKDDAIEGEMLHVVQIGTHRFSGEQANALNGAF